MNALMSFLLGGANAANINVAGATNSTELAKAIIAAFKQRAGA
ncbi:hypothetical protein ACWGS9_28825 [Bradyrhizobium sp. Arg314]